MSYDVVLNGKPLGLPINGIPRYACEVIKAIDQIDDFDCKIAVVIPEGMKTNIEFVRLQVIERPNCIFWDIFQAERFARENDALYVQFSSRGAFYKNNISTIHDIRPITYGEGKLTFKSIRLIIKFYILFKLAVKNSKFVVTDSAFCKSEIEKFSKYNNLGVIGCGWEHMDRLSTDESVFEKYPQIKKGRYYLSVSSIAPHKNFEWIVKNAARNPAQQYVIVGKTDPNMWTIDTGNFKDNIIWLGFQSDEAVKSLIKSAKVLVFPSKYEGFGITPLEALAVGTPAIVSDIPVMREIYGESVSYFDPEEPNVTLEVVESEESRRAKEEVLKKYTWKKAAERWLEIIRDYL